MSIGTGRGMFPGTAALALRGGAAGVRMSVGCGSSCGLGARSRVCLPIAKPGRRPMAFAAAAVTPEKRRQRNAELPVAVENIFS